MKAQALESPPYFSTPEPPEAELAQEDLAPWVQGMLDSSAPAAPSPASPPVVKQKLSRAVLKAMRKKNQTAAPPAH